MSKAHLLQNKLNFNKNFFEAAISPIFSTGTEENPFFTNLSMGFKNISIENFPLQGPGVEMRCGCTQAAEVTNFTWAVSAT